MPKSSPFEPIHKRLGAVFADYNCWNLPSHYGDPAAECSALYNHSAVFDLSSFGRISIKGPDSKKLIDILLAGSTDELIDGKWIWAVICDELGHLADIVRAAKLGDAFTVFTSPAKRRKILSLAQQSAAEYNFANVKITDITEKTAMLALYGPQALVSLDKILPLDLTSIDKHSVKNFSVLMISVTIIRGGWLGLDGIELLCPASVAPMAASAITRYRDRLNISPAGMDCLQTAMLEASLPFLITNSAIGKNISPIALGLSGLIDFEKDFFGKEALQQKANLGPERLLVGLTTTAKDKTHNDLKIQYDDLEIGWSPKIVSSEHLGRSIATAMIDNEFFNLKDQVQIVGDDIVAPAEITPLPFEPQIAATIY